MIQAKMKADGRSVRWLAQQLHCTSSNIYKMYEKQSIDINLLLQVAQLLQVDFFAYYSNVLKEKKITLNE
jgi:hypothetical protein